MSGLCPRVWVMPVRKACRVTEGRILKKAEMIMSTPVHSRVCRIVIAFYTTAKADVQT